MGCGDFSECFKGSKQTNNDNFVTIKRINKIKAKELGILGIGDNEYEKKLFQVEINTFMHNNNELDHSNLIEILDYQVNSIFFFSFNK